MLDPFDLARAETMLVGYSARWYDEPYEVLAVEAEFNAPLRNPQTGAESRTFRLGGKIDVIVRDRRDDRVLNVEHKSSSEDITAGSFYWRRLTLNTQISTYVVGARELGHEINGTLFDVLGKPQLRPSDVPLVDDSGVKIVLDAGGVRVRTKDGKKWRETADSAQGYVLQTRPETVDEFRARLELAIAEEPERYYRRGIVVRLEDEEREAAYDAWQTATIIRESRAAGRFPRNPDSCQQYGSPCAYFPVCSKQASLDDASRYVRDERLHSELSTDVVRLPLLTNSEMATARRCSRQHHYRYDLGIRSVDDGTRNTRFGTLCHVGLEAWWIALGEGAPEDECVGRAIHTMRSPPKPALAKTLPASTAERISL